MHKKERGEKGERENARYMREVTASKKRAASPRAVLGIFLMRLPN